METLQKKIISAIGALYLVASKTSLRGVFFTEQDCLFATSESEKQFPLLQQAEEELREYLCGERQSFSIPLEPMGTAFQKQVWEALKKIPYGETRSYKDIARAVNNARASRAVGTANGRNPLSLIVPCHRVIASDGTLGGYGGGLAIKEQLLEIEAQQKISSRER